MLPIFVLDTESRNRLLALSRMVFKRHYIAEH